MDDVALANYIAGVHKGNVEAGRVDRMCAQLLSVPMGTEIWFSSYTLEKLRRKHGEINFSHYRHLPAILLNGFLARGRHEKLIDLWWIDVEALPSAEYFVVLKATRKAEVFIETFHRINIKETRRLIKRAKKEGRLFREQPGIGRHLQIGTEHLKSRR